MRARSSIALVLVALLAACGDSEPNLDPDLGVADLGPSDMGRFTGDPPPGPWFERGGEGVSDPLSGVGARAGRATAGDLPDFDSGLQVWAEGDFILANERIALVIEDVGPSDLYDPWGGRPVGMGMVEGGQLVRPADFGEFFVLIGRMTPVTEFVGVINDGTNGEAAVVRAQGRPAGVPLLEFAGQLFATDYGAVPTAIDYVLEPGAEHVDVFVRHQSYFDFGTSAGSLRGFMYTNRMPSFSVGSGFGDGIPAEVLAFVDDDATSWAYRVPGERMDFVIERSGFIGMTVPNYALPAAAETTVHLARLYLGASGLDGVLQAVARTDGVAQREVSGTVYEADGTTPAAGVRVHAEVNEGTADPVYYTRVTTDAAGAYALHVPSDADIQLTLYRKGDVVQAPTPVPVASSSADLTMLPSGLVRVVVTDADTAQALPARVQLLPVGGGPEIPSVPDAFGEPRETGGRLHAAFATGDGATPVAGNVGDVTLRAPPGQWEVVVSRGTEYSLHREVVDVVAGAPGAVTNTVNAALMREIDTTGVMCADFHVHTARSNDSGDPVELKMRQAIADGLDIPARSEHEFVEPLDQVITGLGLGQWAFGLASEEVTPGLFYGHFGALGIQPCAPTDAGCPPYNGGAPQWILYPTAADRDQPVVFIEPPAFLATIRARPETPRIIINHPRGSTDYFDYVGLDPLTGTIDNPDAWDEEFRMVEIFNDSGYLRNREGTVRDWFNLLNTGRVVYAVGSSDSHVLRRSPVGFPSTCLDLGTDDPRSLTDAIVTDAAYQGRSTVSGGVHLTVGVGGVGPGASVNCTTTPAACSGDDALVDVVARVPTWIGQGSDAEFVLEVIVDGVVHETIDLPDAAPVLYDSDVDGQLLVPIAAEGSWVVLVVYSDNDTRLDPVFAGAEAFGVSNPIFLSR